MKRLSALLVLTLALAVAGPAAAQEENRPRGFQVGNSAGPLAALGTLRCRQRVELGFAVRGMLTLLKVDEGDRVRKDQLLASLDERVTEAETQAQKARVAEAQAAVSRAAAKKVDAQELYKTRAGTKSQMVEAGFLHQEAIARLELARAELAVQQAQLAQLHLDAPWAGVILKREAETGQVVEPGKGILTLGDCAVMYAEVEFGEKLYTRLEPGMEVALAADALPGRNFTGRVDSISPQVDEKTRTLKVKVAMENPDFLLRPGMFARASLRSASQGPIWVPEAAILSRHGDQGEVEMLGPDAGKRTLRLGRDLGGGRVEVTQGLESGEVVRLPDQPAGK